MIEATRALPEKISKYCEFTVSTCAYAGTGNVIKIQQLLQECGKHHDEETEMIQKIHQGVAVAGLSIVAMGERVGSSMILRSFDHLLQYVSFCFLLFLCDFSRLHHSLLLFLFFVFFYFLFGNYP